VSGLADTLITSRTDVRLFYLARIRSAPNMVTNKYKVKALNPCCNRDKSQSRAYGRFALRRNILSIYPK
jgi:hypothetical protein